MYGPAVRCKRNRRGWRNLVSRQCIRPLVERIWLLAIMEVSAHAILLTDKPLWGCAGHQFSRAPERPLLHFFLSLSQTSVGNWVSRRHVHGPSCFSYFFCSTAPQAFSRPDRGKGSRRRADAVKAGRL